MAVQSAAGWCSAVRTARVEKLRTIDLANVTCARVVDQRATNIDTGGLSAVGISISSATISLSALRRLFRRCPGARYAER